MDDNLKEKKYLNNNILIDSGNIINKSKYIISKNNNDLKFNSKVSSISPKTIYSNHSFTERKYKFQEYKENINTNENDENKKFIRLKKGLHFRIKNKTSRNNNNNNINKEAISYKTNKKEEKNFKGNLFQKEIGRKSEFLTHSYSYDYLNLNSNLGFKFKPSLQNTNILSQNFVKGMKNQKRKLDLINAIEKYNKYKTLFTSKSERQIKSKNALDENNDENEKESVEKRMEQINRIKIQNIINFKNVYESIQNRKDMNQRKTDYGQEKNHKEIFVRKILREEKYTIGDDGKEKILEINQSFLPNKVNIDSIDNLKLNDNTKEKKLVSLKSKENNRQALIIDENIINDNNENNNDILQKRRSYQNLNNNFNKVINENKNIIFIKKHPKKLKINDSSKLNNRKIINQSSINKNLNSNYIILDNHNRNHSYREIKNLSHNNINQKYQNNSYYNPKLLNNNLNKNISNKNNIPRNQNIYMTNHFSNNHKENISKNKNKFYTNRICHSKGYTNNNFIHEIINTENKIGPKQFILFNLNNFNNTNKNQNNNLITIYTSPNYK